MTRLEDMRLVPLRGPGEGRVARHFGSVLLVSVEAEAVGAAALIELCRDHGESGGSGGALVERVTSLLARAVPGSVPAFCLVVQVDAGMRAIVNGDVELTIGDGTTASPQRAHSDRASWTTIDVTPNAYLSATLSAVPLRPIDAMVDLRRGVSTGTAFVLVGANAVSTVDDHDDEVHDGQRDAEEIAGGAAAPAPAAVFLSPPPPPRQPSVPLTPPPPPSVPLTPPPPPSVPLTPQPRAGETTFEIVDLATTGDEVAEEPLAPLPLVGETPRAMEYTAVRGLNCARGHFNDPAAQYCAVCGLQMGQASYVLVEGERPPLGVLVFDNGDSHTLAHDLIIGRDPRHDTAVELGRARIAVPAGDASGLSRVHAEIRLVEWAVQLIDRQSTNGTFVWDTAHGTWRRLAPNEPTTLSSGDRLAFGPRTAVFESTVRTG